jgi:hypothetical protein
MALDRGVAKHHGKFLADLGRMSRQNIASTPAIAACSSPSSSACSVVTPAFLSYSFNTPIDRGHDASPRSTAEAAK